MLTGLVGTGSAILLAGFALIIAKFRGHLPGRHTDQWVLTAAVVVMALAGVLAAYMGLGHWIISGIHGIEGFFGPSAKVIMALIAFSMLLLVVVAIFRTATDAALWIAFGLPVVSAAINGGIFRDLNNFLKPAADQFQAMLRAKLGA